MLLGVKRKIKVEGNQLSRGRTFTQKETNPQSLRWEWMLSLQVRVVE